MSLTLHLEKIGLTRLKKIDQAVKDLQKLNAGNTFKGKSFLDIGCGSGLHALAAIRLGVKTVTCIDKDHNSIEATRKNLLKFSPLPQPIFTSPVSLI
jgi:2-polyprenyl-6-hydroxyphenyl methylase/3-demethylubiquinone-9 3-methyltransferase